MPAPRDNPARRMAVQPVRRLALAASKLLATGPAGWWRLARARLALATARREVRGRPLGTLVPELQRRGGGRGDAAPPAEPPGTATSGFTDRTPREAARVEALGLAVDRAARFGFLRRPLCLERSLAYHRLLEGAGISGAAIRVGVRRAPSGFEAHAWVEWRGQVAGEDPSYVARFLPLPLDQLSSLDADGSLDSDGGQGIRWASPAGPRPRNGARTEAEASSDSGPGPASGR